ncbi:MAG: hypothetical protein A2339_05150 [Elusimicrobia bacterium RIFOXYB12_FULL_50_12]|nr:MAG: hypothetical protein A2278_07780 [Elusimicrobia bacterium RIFOXYA12_FULL_49_49]OGS16036.1 MAG: hypothetical protein A2251_02485 [Elusimicrobia bacterium RIFOXYA2_FULL_47_53]OGS25793.1 MAG: hypothetical protein A2339_05150 [Elusimicrobia bacterium RIFOXYB12_FULL_50_12]OGS30212.1 MAG: hypothetical protein A2323_02050 [Elusimicrobia bacterium RIFOXYB2_FULL_46_23]
MKITKIARQKKKKEYFSVFLDGRYAFSVSEETLLKSGLEEGLDLNNEKIKGIISSDEPRRAMDDSWRFLGFRQRSVRELSDYLKRKGYYAGTVKNVVAKLSELGYLNDAKFAADRLNYLKSQKKGPELIKADLIKKGIASDIISSVISQGIGSPKDEAKEILELARKKMAQMKGVEPRKAYNRLMGFIARRGFRVETAREVLRRVRGLSEEEE